MLIDEVEDATTIDPTTLHARYLTELGAILDRKGIDQVAEETGIDQARLRALPDGDPGLTLREACAIVAATDAYPDAEAAVTEVRDHLLLRMSSAIVDVDALALALDDDFGPREYQQKIEGRMEMTLEEYAGIVHHVESERQY